jgi:hypothetical protein
MAYQATHGEHSMKSLPTHEVQTKLLVTAVSSSVLILVQLTASNASTGAGEQCCTISNSQQAATHARSEGRIPGCVFKPPGQRLQEARRLPPAEKLCGGQG